MNACKGSRSRGRAGRGEPASLVLKAAGSVIVAVPVLYHIPNYLLPQEREREREREKRERVCICDCDCERETKAVIGILFARCFVIVIVIVIVVVVGACDGP